ncbi:MAG: glycosyltransferase [Aggregatilineales bacterium]
MDVSLIIPAYNESRRIVATLSWYAWAFAKRYESFEIVVVANGCRDNTAQIARDLSENYPQIQVVEIADKIGKGGAILRGFDVAKGAKILFADADGATAPESLIALVDQLRSYDLAIGSRRIRNSQILRRQPLKRRLMSRVFAVSVHLLFDLPYRDTQCGAKAFRHDAAKRLGQLVQEARWTFDIDLLLCARSLNFSVTECPVVWEDRAGSTLHIGSTAKEVLQSLWRLKRRYSNKKLPALVTGH